MTELYDAIVIGGGTAGLSAALALGRAKRRVLVVSCGAPRNAPADAAHNVFTRDGTPPLELLRIAREQLKLYNVAVRDQCATDVRRSDAEYVVTLGGDEVRSRGIIFATGVRDVMPEIPGFRELWGTGVFHCPYCHGWEVRDEPLAVYGRGEVASHFVRLIRGWTNDLVLFTDGPSQLDADELARISANGIVVVKEPIARLEGTERLEAIVLRNGDRIERAGIFMRPDQVQSSDLPHKLGCALTAQGRLEADAIGRTNVPMVFVAGDCGPGNQSVPNAAATGAMAGAGLNLDLLNQEFEKRLAGT